MMKSVQTLSIAVLTTITVLLSACSSSETIADNLPDNYIINMVYPKQNIQLNAEQLRFVMDNNAFAYDFFNRVSAIDGSKSSFCSPLSVSFMLGMLQAGATGETRNQILKVMRMDGSTVDGLNDYCAKLTKELPGLDEKVTLDIANSIYVHNRK